MPRMHVAAYLADHFLIAMPSLADPHFVRGVTLICQHDEFGAMGLVVNHRSEYNLDEVLRQMEIATDSAILGRQPLLGASKPGPSSSRHSPTGCE